MMESDLISEISEDLQEKTTLAIISLRRDERVGECEWCEGWRLALGSPVKS